MQVNLINILTYFPILSYKNGEITHNSNRHAVQYKRPLATCDNIVHWSIDSRTHSHSLVDLPRRRLATADNHSDIFLLHCARSCDISFS